MLLYSVTDFETRFNFPDPNTFPQPEQFSGGNKTYPSKSKKNTTIHGSKYCIIIDRLDLIIFCSAMYSICMFYYEEV